MGLFHSKPNFELLDNPSIKATVATRTEIVKAKNDLDYTNLVLSGGGAKGIAHCGGLTYLEEIGVLESIKRISGTSAGSIVAALFAVGYTPNEIETELLNVDFERFVDNSSIPLSLYHFITQYGWSTGSYVIELIGTLIHAKTGNCNTTFKQLFQDSGIDLVICATDLNIQNTIYLHKDSTPDLPICHAVRMSMSIPFIFAPVSYNGHMVVDGGLLDNCPEHVFDGPTIGDPKAKLNLLPPNKHTIAFDILTPNEMENYQLEKPNEIDGLTDLFKATLNTIITGNERRYITPSFWNRTVGIRVPSIPLTQFSISTTQKKELIKCGYKSCKAWFANKS